MEGIRAILNSSIKKLADSTIFHVTFIKKDGTVRYMQCRTGVKKHLNPNSRGLSDKQIEAKKVNNHLSVFDMTKRAYRTIPCDRILEVKSKGLHLKREKITDEKWELIDNNI